MQCSACGTENEAANQFCDGCGTPLAAGCPRCGRPNRPDARFCGSCGAALTEAHAAPARSETERRLVSVLFADLVGFTTLAEERDPEQVRELATRYFDTATEVIEAHGGTVEKFIGDAVMAVWGTPVAHEDDAERAVRAALELVDRIPALEPGLQARAAINSGDAAVTIGATNQGMVTGDLVNTAARLQGVADPGTLVVDESTMRAASPAIAFERIGEQTLKGKTSPVPAWQALRVVAARGGEGRTDALEPPFVGRVEELRQLKDLLHTVGRERRPRLVLVSGIAGIGKSRLVWELEKYVDGVTEQIRWHRGRSPSYGNGITFWALGEMVRRRAQLSEGADEATTRERIAASLKEFVPDASDRERIGPALLSLLGVEAAPPGGRDALFPAWRSFFEAVAATGTTVLVFEDLQWADAGLLDFIEHLLEWSRDLPIMVIALTRPELFDGQPGWGSGHRLLTTFALEPLTDDDMRAILTALVPDASHHALGAIVARAEGIPLYAVETLRGLLAEGRMERRGEVYVPTGDLSELAVPESLRSLIASRLDALDAADRALIQDAAVLGHVFSAELLAAVIRAEPEALAPRLRALARRELIDVERDPSSPEHGQYRFVQSLIREVAYGTLSRRDRRAKHLAVARQFEAIGDPEMAGALASHYLSAHAASEAGEEADALAVQARLALLAAADRAARLGSPEQALSFVDAAIGITSEPSERARLQDRAAAAASQAGVPSAIDYVEAAIATYHQVGDEVGALHASARLGEELINFGLIARARELLEATRERLSGIDAPDVLAETLSFLSRIYMRLAMHPESIAAADEALAIAEARNLEGTVTEAILNKGTSLSEMGRPREGSSLLRTAVERAAATGNAHLELRARNNLAAALVPVDPHAATGALLETLEVARNVGVRAMYNWMLGTATWALLDEGRDWDEHIARIQDAAASAPIHSLRLRSMLAAFQAARGEALDTMESEIRDLLGDDQEPDNNWYAFYASAQVALARGDYDAAFSSAFRAIEVSPLQPVFALAVAFRAAVWARNLPAVRTVADRLAAVPGHGAGIEAFRQRVAAAVAALEGRQDEAVALLRDARAALVDMSQRFEAANVALEGAILMPDHPAVRSWADDARADFESLRARPYLERLDAALGAGSAAATVPAPLRQA